MTTNENKRLAFETAYAKGMVTVFIALRTIGTVMPSDAAIANVGLGMPEGIIPVNYSPHFTAANIRVMANGIHAKLSFFGVRSQTFVPWEAIISLWQGGKQLEHFGPGPQIDIATVDPNTDMTADIAADPEMAKWFNGTVAEG